MSDWTEWQIRDGVRDLRQAFDSFADDNQGQVTALRQRVTEIEQQLDRLSSGVFAFAELSELRRDLDAFATETAWRSYARRLAAVRATTTVPAEPELADCPDYWLPPATRALAALLRGDEIAAERPTAEAQRRDRERTALFLTLGLAGAGRQALAAYWLHDAFGPIEGPVQWAQRALWIAAATDVFGPTGWDLGVARLAAVAPQNVEKELTEWGAALGVPSAEPARSPRNSRLSPPSPLRPPPSSTAS